MVRRRSEKKLPETNIIDACPRSVYLLDAGLLGPHQGADDVLQLQERRGRGHRDHARHQAREEDRDRHRRRAYRGLPQGECMWKLNKYFLVDQIFFVFNKIYLE